MKLRSPGKQTGTKGIRVFIYLFKKVGAGTALRGVLYKSFAAPHINKSLY